MLCTEENQSLDLEAFLACRLIPLNKNPGIRLIGIGEILRRIVGKAVMKVAKEEIIASVGTLQVCAGHEAGCEAIVHTMRKIFEDEETDAVILVDASYASRQQSCQESSKK